jgi:hypothetical protein
MGASTSGAVFAVALRLNWSMSDGVVLAFVIAAAVVGVAFLPAACSNPQTGLHGSQDVVR